ncbi:acyl-CoA N-acyltransferase [Choanephora cucurbitarum]|nr:acyl-CoA N-acyltransferase [Choanephora cucurbitarum]
MLSTIHVQPATPADKKYINAAHRMINAAFRSSDSWTTDTHLVSIDRVSCQDVEELVEKSGNPDTLLYAFDRDTIIGCILISPRENNTVLLSLLAVSPTHQSRGIGKMLIREAIEYTKSSIPDAKEVQVHVFQCRKELIDWYVRLGFLDEGILLPFPHKQILLVNEAPLSVLKFPISRIGECNSLQ